MSVRLEVRCSLLAVLSLAVSSAQLGLAGCLKSEVLFMSSITLLRTFAILSSVISIAVAQEGASPAAPARAPSDSAAYILGRNDEITARSLQMKDIADKVFRLDQEGYVNFPLIGRIQLSNLSTTQAEALLNSKLKTYYVEPDLQLSVSAFRTEPVSVIGAVGTPGIHEMKGRTTLLDALSLAGGVRGDAGPVVVITRDEAHGPIPGPNAHTKFSGESVAEVDLRSLLDARDPAQNILIQPHDVISIPPAETVYVVGNVKRPGGFPLSGKSSLSVLQAVSLAEGFDPRAQPERARILRRGTQAQQQIAVDLKKILNGKSEDVILQSNDILYVPSSTTKVITTRAIETAVQIGSGLIIFATHF
jgi:polysaccharide export outer membrane protein